MATCIFCIWLIWKSVTPALPESSRPPKIYSNPSREDLRLTFISAIGKAKKSIFLCMFGLNDPALLHALSAKSKKNIPINIYYDTKGSPDIRKHIPGAVIHPILTSGIMHQKIMILDDETVFLGSANFTNASLKMHDNLVIGLKNQKIAHFLKERVPNIPGYMRCLVGGQDVELWLLPDLKGHALTDLKRKMKQASRSIQVALFTLTHHILIEELIQARKRGVDVTVILDMHSSLGASRQALEMLTNANIRVLVSQGVQLMHHKFAYIDERILIAGSANWTKAAFAKNCDSFIVLHNVNAEQKACMKKIWKKLITTAKPPVMRK
ncbi:MAG TPA: phospholipase D-like domain-containing protein [Chlamydiales bacterium]|nr:phospholipase D-like domain-containing protein [Chlamydiales bacterium]